MSNSISYQARADLPSVEMNNGLTSVVVSVLSLAASSLAATDRQRLFAVWFASRDQGVFGSGMVGFDLSELPWSEADFGAEKAFVLRVIAAAQARTGWERLDYRPHEEWVMQSLEGLRVLVQAFEPAHRCPDPDRVWPFAPPPSTFERCPLHGVYQPIYGCPICNDQ
ncbi:MAG: hypothetical protein SFU83_22100 [Meiothermus sp.]|nr:hypothetical protein [Meiothermus sp.]